MRNFCGICGTLFSVAVVPYFQLLELEEYHSYGILEAQATESKALCLTRSNQKQSNFNTRVVCLKPRVKPLMLVRVRPLTHVSLIFLKKKIFGHQSGARAHGARDGNRRDRGGAVLG